MMNLQHEVSHRAASGRQLLGEVAREIVARTRPDLAERLPAETSELAVDAYTEPLVFAYYAGGQPKHLSTLDQVLVGYSHNRDVAAPAVPNSRGVVSAPRIGNFLTSGESPCALQQVGAAWSALAAGRPPVHRSSPPWLLHGWLEVTEHELPLISSIFRASVARSASLALAAPDTADMPTVETALCYLRDCQPSLYTLLASHVRRVVLFQDPRLNSFAAPSAHGTVFLNTCLGNTPAGFVEDLAHQGGHVAFYAATFGDRELLRVPRDQPLSELGSHAADARGLYVALHGLVTQTWISESLDGLRWHDDGQRAAGGSEVLGRLAFSLQRLRADLAVFLTLTAHLGPVGLRYLEGVHDAWQVLSGRNPDLMAADVTNQGYNFSLKRYLERNTGRFKASSVEA